MWDTENQKTFINEKPLGKPSSKPFKGTNIASMVFNTKGKQPSLADMGVFSGLSLVKMRVFHQSFGFNQRNNVFTA